MAQLTLTEASTGNHVTVEELNIIYVQADTLGSLVTYIDQPDGQRLNLVCSDAPATIAGMSAELILVTIDGKSVYVNNKRILLADTNATGVQFLYDAAGASPRQEQTTDSEQTFYTRSYQKSGFTVYAFDDVNATNDTISLTAANGDKTASFTAGVFFTVFGSATDTVNGIYKVTSSAFSGGKTVISVDTAVKAVPTGATETGSLYIR